MALLSCWLQESLFLGTPFWAVFQGGADFLGLKVKVSARRLDQQTVLDWPSQAGLGPARDHCSMPGRGHPGGSHNPRPHSAQYQTRRHQGTCTTCQSHRGGQLLTHGDGAVRWTCPTLRESVKVFFLDIKRSKSHKCEKQAPAIFS